MKSLKKNVLIRISAIIAAVLLAMTMPSGIVFAESPARASIDLSKKGSLTITHISVDNELMENVKSYIYLVATIDEDGQYTITDEFKGCFSDPEFFNNGYDYDSWKSCVMYDEASDSDLLGEYISSNGISEKASGVSDSNGKTVYKDLTLGVYYVKSDKVKKDEYTHSFVNFVYPVPILEADKDTGRINIDYNPEASPKKAKEKNDVVVHCNVIKRWVDKGNEDKRPVSITFKLYCDGEFWKEITLNAQNNWYYEWEMEGLHDFAVKEVSAGKNYKGKIKTIKKEGHDFEFICTNTYNPPDNPPGPPDNPPGPPDNPPGPPENPPGPPGIPNLPEVLGAVRELPAVLGARRLPQTGQLWWPLPILVIAGVAMIVKGIKKNSRKNA